jgi:hypothetical protein
MAIAPIAIARLVRERPTSDLSVKRVFPKYLHDAAVAPAKSADGRDVIAARPIASQGADLRPGITTTTRVISGRKQSEPMAKCRRSFGR